MDKGWIKVHRKISDHWLWDIRPFSKGQAWIDILIRANHTGRKVPLGNDVITVESGSFVTSEVKLMEAWGWSKSKLRSFLKLLEKDRMITKVTDRQKTTIFVLHWEEYQLTQTTDEPQADWEENNKRPRADTNKNVKNVKNEKNAKKFIRPSIEEIADYISQKGYSVNAQRFFDHYESVNWYRGKTKIKDWKACIRTWDNRTDRVKQSEKLYEKGDDF